MVEDLPQKTKPDNKNTPSSPTEYDIDWEDDGTTYTGTVDHKFIVNKLPRYDAAGNEIVYNIRETLADGTTDVEADDPESGLKGYTTEIDPWKDFEDSTSGETLVKSGNVTNTKYFIGLVDLKVDKTLKGRGYKNGDDFVFALTAKDGTPMPIEADQEGDRVPTEVIKHLSVSEGNMTADTVRGTVDFGKIAFTRADMKKKTIKYGDASGTTPTATQAEIDSVRYWTANVETNEQKKNNNGDPIYLDGNGNETTEADDGNGTQYAPVMVTEEKTFDMKKAKDVTAFNALPDAKKNAAEGTVMSNTFTYKITENPQDSDNGDSKPIKNDKDVEQITVNVLYDQINIKMFVSAKDKNGEFVTGQDATVKDIEQEPKVHLEKVFFENEYEAEGTYKPEATKILDGGALKQDQFTFRFKAIDTPEIDPGTNKPVSYSDNGSGQKELIDVKAEDTPMPGKDANNKPNKGNGTGGNGASVTNDLKEYGFFGGLLSETGTDRLAGPVSFDDITYTSDDLKKFVTWNAPEVEQSRKGMHQASDDEKKLVRKWRWTVGGGSNEIKYVYGSIPDGAQATISIDGEDPVTVTYKEATDAQRKAAMGDTLETKWEYEGERYIAPSAYSVPGEATANFSGNSVKYKNATAEQKADKSKIWTLDGNSYRIDNEYLIGGHLPGDSVTEKPYGYYYLTERVFTYEMTEDIPGEAKATINGTEYTYSEAIASSSVTKADIESAKWKLNGTTYDAKVYIVGIKVTDNKDGTVSSEPYTIKVTGTGLNRTIVKDSDIDEADDLLFRNEYEPQGKVQVGFEKVWDDSNDALKARKDAVIHLDASYEENGHKVTVKDIRPPQTVDKDATGNNLKGKWGTDRYLKANKYGDFYGNGSAEGSLPSDPDYLKDHSLVIKETDYGTYYIYKDKHTGDVDQTWLHDALFAKTEDGSDITYSVREDVIPGYSTKITEGEWSTTDPKTKTFTVTNKIVSGTVNIYATKSMDGRSFADGDKFSFMISGKDGAPMPVKYENNEFTADEVTKDATLTTGTVKGRADLGMIAYTVSDLKKTNITYEDAVDESKKEFVTEEWNKDENGEDYKKIVYVKSIPGDAVAEIGSIDPNAEPLGPDETPDMTEKTVVKYSEATVEQKAQADERSESGSLWRSKDGKIKYTTAAIPIDAVNTIYENTFTYKIMENPQSKNDKDHESIENDKSVKEIKVYVLWDPSEGKIYASAAKNQDNKYVTSASDITVAPGSYSSDMKGVKDLEDVYFTNKYTSKGTWTPDALKILKGRPLERDDFRFKIRAADTKNGSDVVVRKEDTPMPGKTKGGTKDAKGQDVKVAGEGEAKGTNNVNGPVSFGEIEYTHEDLAQKVVYNAAPTEDQKTQYPGIRRAESAEQKQSVTWEWTEGSGSSAKTYVYGLIPDDAQAEVTVNGDTKTVSFGEATDAQRKAAEGTTKDTKWTKDNKYYIGIKYNNTGKINNDNLIANGAVGTVYLKERTFTYEIYEDVPDDAKAKINGTEYTYAQAKADSSISDAMIGDVKWKKNGYLYDASIKSVTVKVTDNYDGTITAEPTYAPDKTFENEYKAAGDVKIMATKDIEGKQFDGTNKFTFTLQPKTPGAPKPAGANSSTGITTVEITPTTGSTFDFDFGDISFTHEDLMSAGGTGTKTDYDAVRTKDGYYQKTFLYELKETAVTGTGVNKDPKTITVAITVQEDKEGNITVVSINSDEGLKVADLNTLKTKELGFTVDREKADTTSDPTKDAHSTVKAGVFTNEYNASGSVTIKATKKLETAASDNTVLDENQFYFELLGKKLTEVENASDADVTIGEGTNAKYYKVTYEKVLDTKPNAAPVADNKGLITFDTLTYSFDKVKEDAEKGIAEHTAKTDSAPEKWTYTYKVKEIVPDPAGRASGITYDTSEKTVVVVVTDKGDGTLEVKKYLGSESDANLIPDTDAGNEKILFTNKLETVNIPVQKIWEHTPVEDVTLRLERALIDPYKSNGDAKTEAEIKTQAEGLDNSSWKTDGRRLVIKRNEFDQGGGTVIIGEDPAGQGSEEYKGFLEGFNKNVPIYVTKDGNFMRAVYRITEDNTSSEYNRSYSADGTTEQRIYATTDSATPLTVKNTTVAKGVGDVAAVKQLVGREWTDSDEYKFILEPLGKAEYEVVEDPDTGVKSNIIKLDAQGNVVYVKKNGETDKAIPMPSATDQQVIYASTPAEESAKRNTTTVGEGERLADFNNIHFRVKDLTYDEIDGHMQGDFYYTMKEKIPDNAVLYDRAKGKPVNKSGTVVPVAEAIKYVDIKNRYTAEDLKGTEWKVIDESDAGFNGMVYDGTIHTVRIKVRGTRNENFMVQTIYDQTDQAADKTGTPYTPVYTNHYESKGTIDGVFAKDIVGRTPDAEGNVWKNNDEFTFKLQSFNGDDAPMPLDDDGDIVKETIIKETSGKVEGNKARRIGSFGTVHFDESHLYDVYKTGDKAGTRYGIYYYAFYESEIKPDNTDLAKDDSQFFVKVTVEDAGNGKLTTKAEYYRSVEDLATGRSAGEISDDNPIVFENVKTREVYYEKTWEGTPVTDAVVHLEESVDDGATWQQVSDTEDTFKVSEFSDTTKTVTHTINELPTYKAEGYSKVTPETGDNPNQKGWYEITSAGEHVLTADTVVNDEKAYYSKVKNKKISYKLVEDSPTPDYEQVTPEDGDNPKDKGWYERSGAGTTADPYVYTLTKDTDIESGKTYYKQTPYTVDTTKSYEHDENGRDGSTEERALNISNKYTAAGKDKVNVVKQLLGREWNDKDKFNYKLSPLGKGQYNDDGSIKMSGNDVDYIKTGGQVDKRIPAPGTRADGSTATTDDSSSISAADRGIPASKGSTEVASNEHLATFADISFDEKDLIMNPGTGLLQGDFFYEIEEVIPAQAEVTIGSTTYTYSQYGNMTPAEKQAAEGKWTYKGVTYSHAKHKVHIRVTDNLTGKLGIEVAYNESTPGTTASGQGFTPVYTNHYNAKGEVSVPVTKHLNNRNFKSGDSFVFVLEPLAGSPMPKDGDVTKTELRTTVAYDSSAAESNKMTKSFEAIPFTEAGEYIYRIHEVIPSGAKDNIHNGLLYTDEPIYVKIKVIDDQEGNIKAEEDDNSTPPVKVSTIKYYTDSACRNEIKDDQGNSVQSAEFTNHVLRDIEVTKQWQGDPVENVWISIERKLKTEGDDKWTTIDELEFDVQDLDAQKRRIKTFENLPVYDDEGNEYEYRVAEDREPLHDHNMKIYDANTNPDGEYKWINKNERGVPDFGGNDPEPKKVTVKNLNITTTKIEGSKDWIDGDDREHADTSKDIGAKLRLHASYGATTDKVVSKYGDVNSYAVNANDDIVWKWTDSDSDHPKDQYEVENLPKFDAAGNKITYWVEEVVNDDGEVGDLTINEGTADEEVVTYDKPVYANSDDPDTSDNEANITDKALDGGKITNKIKQEKIKFYGQKVWDHEGNTPDHYPASVMMRLYQKKKGDSDASAVTGKTLTINGTADSGDGDKETDPEDEDPASPGKYNKWNFQFADLDRYDDDGNEIAYSIREDRITGYKQTGTAGTGKDSNNRYKLTNKFGSKALDVINVKKTVEHNLQWHTDTGAFKVVENPVDADLDKYYERSGDGSSASPYTYEKTTDTRVDSAKTYYAMVWPQVGEGSNKDDAKFVINLINQGNDQDIAQPMPKTDDDKGVFTSPDGRFSRIVVDSEAKYNKALGFGEMEFDTAGKYTYTIREITPAEAGVTRIAGMTYDDKIYTLVVTVTEDQQTGELSITTKVTDNEGHEISKTGDEYVLPIENEYSQDESTYHMEAHKDYYDRTKTHQDSGEADVVINTAALQHKFSYTLRPVKLEDEDEDADKAPMPDTYIYDKKTGVGLQGNGKDRIYYTRNNYGNVEFEQGMTFKRDRGDGSSDIGKKYTYELAEVIPDNAVYMGEGFWFNEEDQTVYDGVIHFRRLVIGERNGAITVTPDTHNPTNDKMIPAEIGQKYSDAVKAAEQKAADEQKDIIEVYVNAPAADPKYPRHKKNLPQFINNKNPVVDIQAEKNWDDDKNRDGKRPKYTYFTIKRLKTGSTTEYVGVVDILGNNLTTKKDAGGNALPADFTTATVKIKGTADDATIKALWKNLPQFERTDTDSTQTRPVYKEIKYVVEETDENGAKVEYNNPFGTSSTPEVERYKVTVSNPSDTKQDNDKIDRKYTVTNKHDPEKISVKITKTWDDGNNVDGKRPAELKVYLAREVNDEQPPAVEDDDNTRSETRTVEDHTLTSTDKVTGSANKWSYTWANVYKYHSGNEITYWVREDADDINDAGYKAKNGKKVKAVATDKTHTTGSGTSAVTTKLYEAELENEYTPASIDVEAMKVWDDDNDRDGKRQDAKFRLMADGSRAKDTSGAEVEDKTVEKSKADGSEKERTVKWTKLPVNKFAEVSSPTGNPSQKGWYERSGTGTTTDPYVYDLTADTEVDNDKTYYESKAIIYSVVEVDGSGNAQRILDGTTGTAEDGNHESYKKNETSSGYTVSIEQTEGTGGKAGADGKAAFKVTNKYEPEKAYIKVIKDWDDNENQDDSRKGENISMKVHIYKTVGDKMTYVGTEVSKKVTAANNSYVVFGPLPIYENVNGTATRIKYTIEEEASGVYSTKYILGKASSKNDDGTYKDEDYVTNADVNDKEATYLAKTHTINNPYIIGLRNIKVKETTSVEVTKIWDDSNDADGQRPSKIWVDLYKTTSEDPRPTAANLKAAVDAKIQEDPNKQPPKTVGDWTLVEREEDLKGDGWIHTFSDLDKNEVGYTKTDDTTVDTDKTYYSKTEGTASAYPAYNKVTPEETDNPQAKGWYEKDSAGKLITYYVVEEIVGKGYTQTAEVGNQNKGFTITNRREREKVNVKFTKHWDDKNNVDSLRPSLNLFEDNIRLFAGKQANGSDAKDVTAKYATNLKLATVGLTDYTFTWEDLPKYEDKQLVYYFIRESIIPNDDNNDYKAYDSSTLSQPIPAVKSEYTGKTTLTKTSNVLANFWDEVTTQTGDKPKEEGWFERSGAGTGTDPYVYTVTTDESVQDGKTYYASRSEGRADITNLHTPDMVDITARKIWNDKVWVNGTLQNAPVRPDTVKLTLQQYVSSTDHSKAGTGTSGVWIDHQTQKVSKDNADFVSTSGLAETWLYTFKDLQKTDSDNKVYRYRVVEKHADVPNGYVRTYFDGSTDPTDKDPNVIVNTYQITSIKGKKVWKDTDNTVTHDTSEEVKLNVFWKTEYAPANDESVVEGKTYYSRSGDTYTAVTPQTGDNPKEKDWFVKEDKNGEVTNPHIDWSRNNYTVAGLPKYDKYGVRYIYWTVEQPIQGYKTAYNNNNNSKLDESTDAAVKSDGQKAATDKGYNDTTITNTFDGKAKLSGTKTWVGGNADKHVNASGDADSNGVTDDKLGIKLYRDGTRVTTVKVDGEDKDLVVKWDANTGDSIFRFGYIDNDTFKEYDFDIYDEANNKAYVYTVDEDAMGKNDKPNPTGAPLGYAGAVNDFNITNTYSADPAKITPIITKKVEGMPEEVEDEVKKFTFILAAKDSTSAKDQQMPAPVQTSKQTVTFKANKTSAQFDFGELTFTKTGTYKYDLYEQAEDGWTSDNPVMTITINVTDNDEGKLVAKVDRADRWTEVIPETGDNPKAKGWFVKTSAEGEPDAYAKTTEEYVVSGKKYYAPEYSVVKPYITNTYDKDAKAVVPRIAITKELTGARPLNKDEFKFTLTGQPASGSYKDASDKTAAGTNSKSSGNNSTFDTVELSGVPFTKDDPLGTYLFILEETKESLPGITYDETKYRVEAKVTDKDTDGDIEVEWKVISKKPADSSEWIVVSPAEQKAVEFSNAYDKSSTDATPVVQKQLIVPAGSERKLEEGEFEFRIAGTSETGTDKDIEGSNEGGNADIYKDVKWGTAANPAALTFTFDDLKNENGTFDTERYFTFVVNEKPGDDTKIAYDGGFYTGKLRLYVDTDGSLKHEWTWKDHTGATIAYKADDPDKNPLKFDNTYVPDSTDSSLTGMGDNDGKKTVMKTLDNPNADNRELKANEFAFLLTGMPPIEGRGTVDATHLKAYGLNDEYGNVTFPAFPFTEKGEYEFILREVQDGDPTISEWDRTTYQAMATVTEEKDEATGKTTGQFKISWTLKKIESGSATGTNLAKAEFTNKIMPETISVPVVKVWKGDTKLGVATSDVRPDSVKVRIYIDKNGNDRYDADEEVYIKDGAVVPKGTDGATVVADKTLKESDPTADGSKWTAEFKNLPKFTKNGEDIEGIEYSVTELKAGTGNTTGTDELQNYTTAYTQPKDNDGIALVTNTLKPTTIEGTKVWKEDAGIKHTNSKDVKLHVFYQPMKANRDPDGNPVEVDNPKITWSPDELTTTATNYTSTFTVNDLPKYDKYGHEYDYWIKEDKVNGYEKPVYTAGSEGGVKEEDGKAIAITNKGIITNTASEKIDVPFNKVWQSDTEIADQESKVRPKYLTIRLYIDKNKDGKFNANLSGDSAEEVYVIRTEDSIKLADETDPGAVEVAPVKISKQGMKVGDNWEGSSWAGVFSDLPRCDQTGKKISYSIEEVGYTVVDKSGQEDEKEGVPKDLPGKYTAKYSQPDPTKPTKQAVITNTYEMSNEKVTIEATKEWAGDSKKKDGRREVRFTLYQTIDGAKKAVKDTSDDTSIPQADRITNPKEVANGTDHNENRTATWTVPKYYGSEEIQYTVEETEYNDSTGLISDWKEGAPEGYTCTVQYEKDGSPKTWEDEIPSKWKDPSKWTGKVRVTNRLVGSGISIPVRKVWADSNNQDGLRGNVVVAIKQASNSQGTWNGKDLDGKVLVESGEPTAKGKLTLTDNNNYKDKFDKLPAYDDEGGKISYSVYELTIAGQTPGDRGYTVDYALGSGSGLVYRNTPVESTGEDINIRNTHTLEKISVRAEKRWLGDAEVKKDTRKDVTFFLIGRYTDSNGRTIVAYDGGERTIKIGDGNPAHITVGDDVRAGEVTWNDLPRYFNGHELKWTVYEDNVPGYVVSGGDKQKEVKDGNGKLTGYEFVIRNKYVGSVRSVTAEKIWEDEENVDGKRSQIYFQLYRQIGPEGNEESVGDPVEVATGSPNFETDMKYTWNNLPETLTGKGRTTYDEVDANAGTVNPKDKGWYEKIGEDYVATEDVTVQSGKKYYKLYEGNYNQVDDSELYNGDNPKDKGWYEKNGNEYVKTDDETVQNGKTYYEENDNETELPVYYSVKEVHKNGDDEWVVGAPDDYDVLIYSTKPGEFEVRNILKDRESVHVRVQKKWNDADDADGLRPSHIVIRLMKGDGEGVEVAKAVVEESDEWIHTFGHLPKFEKDGEEIKYWIKEDDVEGYTMTGGDEPAETDAEGDTTFTITNTHNVEALYKMIAVKKWTNDSGHTDARKDVKFHLIKVIDGEKEEIKDTRTIKKTATGKDLTVEWDKLPVIEGGKKVSYTVKEDEIDGYTTSVSDTKVDNKNKTMTVTVTNKYVPGPPAPEPVPVPTAKTKKVTYLDPRAKSGKMILDAKLYAAQGDADKAAKAKSGAPKDPQHEGYEFIGWEINQDEFGDYIMVAKYSEVVTTDKIVVSYVDGNSKEGIVKYALTDDPSKVEAPSDPNHKGLIFVGWKEAVDANGNIIYIAQYEPYCPKNDEPEKVDPDWGPPKVIDPEWKSIKGKVLQAIKKKETEEIEKNDNRKPHESSRVQKVRKLHIPGNGVRSAKTGDSFNMTMWLAIVAASLALLLIAVFARRKKDE